MNAKLALSVLAVAWLCVGPGASAQQVSVDAAWSQSAVSAGQKQTVYLRVAMTGFEVEESHRTPVNVAIVLDKSGSMSGEKIRHAREAAILALQRLRSDDVASVVVYDTNVNVLVPATKLTDRESVCAAVRSIEAGGTTALFAGVSRGANEVRKFLARDRVNRVVLLSDGLANVGPSAPSDLAELGESLGREGICVTTVGLGLGYNEDLMTQLAMKSDGNHMFAETPSELAGVFESEFGDVLTVAAQDVDVRIDFAPGVRPVRGLGREVEIAGQRAVARLNQLYGGQMKYVLLEVEVPAYPPGTPTTPLADVEVAYTNMKTEARDRIPRQLAMRVADSPATAEASINKDVMASVVEQIGLERNRWALQLRDEGKVDEARHALFDNIAFLNANAERLQNDTLRQQAINNEFNIQNLDPGNWERQRKVMRQEQYKIMKQQKAGK